MGCRSSQVAARASRGVLGRVSGIVGLVEWLHMSQVFETYEKIKKVLEDPEVLDALSETDKRDLLEWLGHARYNWELNALEIQKVPPGKWTTWLLLAGRGFGKTRVGAETVRKFVRDGGYRSIGLIAPTAADARDTMIDGKGGSSLLEITPPDEGLEYFPTKRRLVWKNGAVGSSFSAEEPQRLRGPQHDLLWCLVGSTRVLMADGSRKFISTIEPGDVVRTTGGDRVVFGTSSKESPLVDVSFANGSKLSGSAEHPVLTDRGWVGLGHLTRDDRIYTWNETGDKTSRGTTTATSQGQSSTDTELSTKSTMGLFQGVGTFITRTASRVTTALRTSWRSRLRNTRSTTLERGARGLVLSVATSSPQHGTLSTAHLVGEEPTRLPGSSLQDGVGIAEALSRQGLETTVVSDVSTSGRVGRVYNLEIDGEHNFIANGIVTHNSDELAAWRYLQETWDMAMFGFRLGQNPRHIITTTPRPLSIIKELATDAVPASEMKPNMTAEVVMTRGSTMDNRANLAPNFIEKLMKKYEGTRLGRQELYAEILDDNPNALFKQSEIDQARVEWEGGSLSSNHEVTFRYRLARGEDGPNTFKVVLREIVVAVDPAMTADIESDETGIIVMARDDRNHIYVLEDQTGIYSPNEWARLVIELYQKYRATSIVAEVNQGGDLVENTIRTVEKEMGVERVEYKKVRASRGKISRAEPVGALEEQGRMHHVGDFPKLEDQLTSFAPGYERSPDRVDAYVWGAHHLVVQRENKGFFIA